MKDFRKITLIISCLLSATCLARPPKVIKMIPENGAVDVKPGPCKIRILFDQDMSQGGKSICGGGENYPEFIGEHKWSSKRSFVMSAKLKPNHEYSFSINCSSSGKYFKSVRGESAETLFVTFYTADGGQVDPKKPSSETLESNTAATEALKKAIFNHYSYRDMKGLDWEALFEKYEQPLLNAESPEKFAIAAKQIVGKAKDKHLWFKVGDKRISSYVNPPAANANFKTIEKVVPGFKKQSNIIYSGRYNIDIGYIQITSWSSQQRMELSGFFEALNELADMQALIIDVRFNGGGSEALAREVAGCFIDEPKMYAKNISIDPARPGQFKQIHKRYVQPSIGRTQYRGKVAVLIGPKVMSSCEAFVLMMKQVPGCVLIGEPTQGSSGNPQPYDLGNGVTVYLPSWQAMLPDGTCFEGKGIQPDIPVKAGSDQLKQTDPVIKAALKELAAK